MEVNKMIEKKNGLIIGVMGGVGFIVLSIFAPNKIVQAIAPWFGAICAFAGIVYFFAGDVIFKKKFATKVYSKDLNVALQKGELTPEQAFQTEKDRMEKMIELKKQELEIAKKQVELKKLSDEVKGKMDFGAFVGGGKKENEGPDMMDRLGGLMKTNAPAQPNVQQNTAKASQHFRPEPGMFDHLSDLTGKSEKLNEGANIVKDEYGKINRKDAMGVNDINKVMEVKKDNDIFKRLGEMR
jgi:hypothetical protein